MKSAGNIFNYANRQLCEYQSIFPTVVDLLDHLLFTNGNGYDFDPKKGMIYEAMGKKPRYIDQYPEMNDAEWDKLIEECYAKERKFHEQYARSTGIDLDQLAADCAKYKRVSVTASMFSEDDLYQELCSKARVKRSEAIKTGRYPSFVRTYPLSPGYAEIFNLDENTPGWFLQIAFNLCNAWVKFLNDEIEYDNVWVKPSLRPAPTEQQIANASAMVELFKMIKEAEGYDGWLDKEHKEPESDYADMTWTTKHRDLIAQQAQRLGHLLIACGNFKVGDKVVVKIRDPYHTYGGCAEPMPGMKAVVSDITLDEPRAFGRIGVKFEPEELGYGRRDDDGSDESITLHLRPWILKKS